MQNLQILRKSKNLTLRALSENLKINFTALSKYENGKTEPDHETLKKIADYFNVSIDYLLGRTDCKRKFSQDEYYNIIRIADKLGITIDQLLGGQVDDNAVVDEIHSIEDKVREKAKDKGIDADMLLSDEQIDLVLSVLQTIKAKKKPPTV